MDKVCAPLAAGQNCTLIGLRGSGFAMVAARAAEKASQRLVLCVAANEHMAEILEQDLGFFTDIPIVRYPAYDIPPYIPLSPDPSTVAARLSALYQALTSDIKIIVVASAEALLRRVLPRTRLAASAELLICNEEVDQQELSRRLASAGYESVSLVQAVGEFSVRGGIVDVFPPGFAAPVRVDFFGDLVESIRTFDPISQRSLEHLEEVVLLPACTILFPGQDDPDRADFSRRIRAPRDAENWQGAKAREIIERIEAGRHFPGIEFLLPLFYPALSTPLDYFATDTLLLLADPPEISRSLALAWERITANFQEAVTLGTPVFSPHALFLSPQGLKEMMDSLARVGLYDIADPEMAAGARFDVEMEDHRLLKQELDLKRKEHGLLRPLAERISTWLDRGDEVVMTCRSLRHASQIAELMEPFAIEIAMAKAPYRERAGSSRTPRVLTIYDTPLAQGFDFIDRTLHVLSEVELFGNRRIGTRGARGKKTKAPAQGVRFEELSLGDVVVHRDHGLGVYEGLVSLDLQGTTNDFLLVTYQDGDRLYVPVDRINVVSKYQGLADKMPKIDRLGGHAWSLAKKKVKEAVWAVAQDLLKLYAAREVRRGRAFSPPGDLYRELEESFQYDETPGQNRAIHEVLAGLASDKPMDRLVCGDVAYGKTEVAIRAAFKVVEDGCQVAILVPTTVLAEQHATTFRERLEGLPVTVACVNRFRSRAEQQRIINGLSEGKVDIIIGTHRLLSKDISFKNLGLLIIDEEHRFGVSHKEKIKKFRQGVDVLTLTATPIPRTLQMSLLGIRDLSVIDTAPEHRRKILTFVAQHDDLVIKEAVVRELQRGGQVFFVHNRVRSIHQVAEKITSLVPAARVAVAHGQMAGKELEEIMVGFVSHKVDVLVCTTIIESGLDITNANTIIISRADRLGLADIYQLRGRVGRGNEQSYAYLLVPSMELLGKEAKERLRALMDCGDLGGGFKLALNDLQIRGGGNILGISQSGHIAAVGYDLYLDLLQKTVKDLKEKGTLPAEVEEEIEPEINLRISAHIPAGYIPDNDQRYIAYRRIAVLASGEELDDFASELRERYGELPGQTVLLLRIMAVKLELKKLLITKLEQGRDSLVFTFHADTPVSPEKVLGLIRSSRHSIRFTPDSRLIAQLPEKNNDPMGIITAASEILRFLNQ